MVTDHLYRGAVQRAVGGRFAHWDGYEGGRSRRARVGVAVPFGSTFTP